MRRRSWTRELWTYVKIAELGHGRDDAQFQMGSFDGVDVDFGKVAARAGEQREVSQAIDSPRDAAA